MNRTHGAVAPGHVRCRVMVGHYGDPRSVAPVKGDIIDVPESEYRRQFETSTVDGARTQRIDWATLKPIAEELAEIEKEFAAWGPKAETARGVIAERRAERDKLRAILVGG